MIDNILSRLEKPKRAGVGYSARCPAHDDRGPSLSIREGDDGRVLLHCFAGCTADEVVGAIGLTLADLFPPGGQPRRSPPAPGVSFTDLRKAADLERSIAFIVAADRKAGKAVSEGDKQREQMAHQRIALAGRFAC